MSLRRIPATPSRSISRTLALVLVGALLLAACGSDDGADGDGGGAAATDTSVAAPTTVPLDDLTESAVSRVAVAYGRAVLTGDPALVRPLMSARCRQELPPDRLEAALALILGAMERQQDVDVADVEVEGALVGLIESDGTAEAALLLNSEVFAEQDFAFLEMQPYLYEDGEWLFDGCNLDDVLAAAGRR